MTKSPILASFVAIFFMISVALPTTGISKDSSPALPASAAFELKVKVLSQLSELYNQFSIQDESQIHHTLISQLREQESQILNTIYHSEIKDPILVSQVVSKVQTKMSELKDKVSTLSKAEILENLLITQEELSHLGMTQVAKGAVALLATVMLIPVFVGGILVTGVGACLLPVDIVTFGLLPVGSAVIMSGVLIATGSAVAMGVTWAWAMDK